jgi:hypothetical protein
LLYKKRIWHNASHREVFFMNRFLVLFLLLAISPAAQVTADTPVIATKKYVDSGLATRVKDTVFDSFKINAESFQNRAGGFATAAQGNKADTAVQNIAIATGTNTGTIKLTVDGTSTDNIAIKGLGTVQLSVGFQSVPEHADRDILIQDQNFDVLPSGSTRINAFFKNGWVHLTGYVQLLSTGSKPLRFGANTVIAVVKNAVYRPIPGIDYIGMIANGWSDKPVGLNSLVRFEHTTQNILLGGTISLPENRVVFQNYFEIDAKWPTN